MARGKGNGAGRPKIHTRESILALIPKLEKFFKIKNNYWLGEFAYKNGLWAERLDEFAEKVPEFGQSLKIAKEIQKKRLLEIGFKLRNPAMAIFALKNVSGWRDQPKDMQPQVFNIVIGANGQGQQYGDSVTIGKRNGEQPAVN